MNKIQHAFRLFSHQLFFYLVTHLRHKGEQHLQHFPRQIRFHRRLTQRQLPVEVMSWLTGGSTGSAATCGGSVFPGW